MATAAAPPDDDASSPPWVDLPSDLLREISGRVGTAANYVRFHAVCRSWLDTVPPPDRRPALLPWLVSPRDATGHRHARCIFSSSSNSSAEIRVRDRRWVTSADDGTARYWLRTACWGESPRGRVDPLTGSAAAIPVPRFPDEVEGWEERAVGASCADGTVALCAFSRVDRWNHRGHGFDAALRHPAGDDAEWTLVQRNVVDVPGEEWLRRQRFSFLAYRRGKIILSNVNQWCIESTEKNMTAADDQRWRRLRPRDPKVLVSSGGYLVETRGELLWVFVLEISIYHRCDRSYTVSVTDDLASELSVIVLALHEADNGGVPQWVKRDGRSLADRVLFLAPVRSFAVDAASLGISSGCAYFVKRTLSFWVSDGIGGKKYHPEQSRVFKYSFNDAKSEFVQALPPRWNRRDPFMWVSPRPIIATKKEIPSRIYVGNLPQNVDRNRLRQFFSNHGNVADVIIMYNRKTKRSRGFGFVIMMVAKDDEPADIIAKLHGESFDGRPLQLKLADY